MRVVETAIQQDLRDQISQMQGVRIDLEMKNNIYETVTVPALTKSLEVVNQENKILKKKINTKTFWSIAKDIVIGSLVVELTIQALKD